MIKVCILLTLCGCSTLRCRNFDYTNCLTKVGHEAGLEYRKAIEVCQMEQENRCGGKY